MAEDHQRKNALALASRDAAVMITDDKAEAELPGEIKRLIANPAEREDLIANISKMALKQSDERIAEVAERIVSQHK